MLNFFDLLFFSRLRATLVISMPSVVGLCLKNFSTIRHAGYVGSVLLTGCQNNPFRFDTYNKLEIFPVGLFTNPIHIDDYLASVFQYARASFKDWCFNKSNIFLVLKM
jgi:hypothetical protein